MPPIPSPNDRNGGSLRLPRAGLPNIPMMRSATCGSMRSWSRRDHRPQHITAAFEAE